MVVYTGWNIGCVWCSCICCSWIVCAILELNILAFNGWDEHIFSNFEHGERCHFILLVYRFNQGWKVIYLINVWLHVFWMRNDEWLQLIFSWIDLTKDLWLVTCLKLIYQGDKALHLVLQVGFLRIAGSWGWSKKECSDCEYEFHFIYYKIFYYFQFIYLMVS